MGKNEYTITVIRAEEIRARVSNVPLSIEPPVLYCDSDGACFFDETPNPYLDAIVGVLNDMGREGWILVQTQLREHDMICF